MPAPRRQTCQRHHPPGALERIRRAYAERPRAARTRRPRGAHAAHGGLMTQGFGSAERLRQPRAGGPA